MNGNYSNRVFQNPNDTVTGRSVVTDNGISYLADNPRSNIGQTDSIYSNPWPYGLSEYLRAFIGKKISVKYTSSNGGCCEKKGSLIVTGSDFIGLQPNLTEDLFIIELDQIKCLSVENYTKQFNNTVRR